MLILSRKVGERVLLRDLHTGQPIAIVTLTDIDRNKVRIGIDAGRGVEILREEIVPGGMPPLLPRGPRDE